MRDACVAGGSVARNGRLPAPMVVERITLDDLADRDARKGAVPTPTGKAAALASNTFALSTPETRKE